MLWRSCVCMCFYSGFVLALLQRLKSFVLITNAPHIDANYAPRCEHNSINCANIGISYISISAATHRLMIENAAIKANDQIRTGERKINNAAAFFFVLIWVENETLSYTQHTMLRSSIELLSLRFFYVLALLKIQICLIIYLSKGLRTFCCCHLKSGCIEPKKNTRTHKPELQDR